MKSLQDEIKEFIVFNLHHIHTAVGTLPKQECNVIKYVKPRQDFKHTSKFKTNIITTRDKRFELNIGVYVPAVEVAPVTCGKEVCRILSFDETINEVDDLLIKVSYLKGPGGKSC